MERQKQATFLKTYKMNLLNKIQKELKAPKDKFNTFGQYKYRSAEGILDAVKPLLGAGTLTLTDDIVMVGNRIYVKSTATICDGDKSISVNAFARESETKKGMDDSQITGAASSYARKYALNGLFCIDDTKDADDLNDGKTEPESKPAPVKAPPAKTVPPFMTPEKIRLLETLLNASTVNETEAATLKKSFATLSQERFEKAHSYLTNKQKTNEHAA
jgi:hypothetical protein